jgi:nicotinate-nucleotide adenylyltransferase
MPTGRKIGLFFGSFNPVHCGHLMIASYMAGFEDIDQVWFVVSPQNPLKEKQSLLAGHHRLAMVNLAIEDDPRFRSSNIEFRMPVPSYTIDTVTYLREKHPGHQFYLIAGGDMLPSLHKWKNHEILLEQCRILLYPRPGVVPSRFDDHPSVIHTRAPMVEISSSFIRAGIREGKNMRHFLPDRVWHYIDEMNFYKYT